MPASRCREHPVSAYQPYPADQWNRQRRQQQQQQERRSTHEGNCLLTIPSEARGWDGPVEVGPEQRHGTAARQLRIAVRRSWAECSSTSTPSTPTEWGAVSTPSSGLPSTDCLLWGRVWPCISRRDRWTSYLQGRQRGFPTRTRTIARYRSRTCSPTWRDRSTSPASLSVLATTVCGGRI